MKQKGFFDFGLTGYAIIAAGVLFALMSAGLWIQTKRLERYASFAASVKAEGEAAKARAKQRELQDFLNKERADGAYMVEIDGLRDRLKRLRSGAGGGGNAVPASPGGSSCPQGQACFDRAELERALRGLLAEVRGIVDEGSQIEAALKTAREWARGDKSIPGAP
jgi:hypothetical protein